MRTDTILSISRGSVECTFKPIRVSYSICYIYLFIRIESSPDQGRMVTAHAEASSAVSDVMDLPSFLLWNALIFVKDKQLAFEKKRAPP